MKKKPILKDKGEEDKKLIKAQIIRDLLHNLDPENPKHLEEYKRLRLSFITIYEDAREYAYLDSKLKTTVGIGFNMDDPGAKGIWKDAFAGISKEEYKRMKVLNEEDFFSKVRSGEMPLTAEQIKKLYNSSVKIREKELRKIYSDEFDRLRLNERLALEDCYFNGAKLVRGNTNCCKHLKDYYKTRDIKYLKLAVFEIRERSNPDKEKGVQVRRNGQAAMLDSPDPKSQFYSAPDAQRMPTKIIAKFNDTRIPYGLEDLSIHEDGKYYIWRTSCDDKVRYEHFKLEGKIFSEDHTPILKDPGEDYNCRCHKQPLPANVVVIEDEIQDHKNNFLLPPTTNFNFNNLRSDYMKTTAPTPLNSEHLVYRNQAWEQLKGVSDERRKQIERSGYVDALTEQKWQKINCEVDEQKARLDSLEAAMNRPAFAMSGENADQQNAEYKAAFVEYLRKGNLPQASSLEKKFLSVGSETDGGYFVDKEVSKQIVKKIEANSIMRKLASIEEVSTHVLEVLEDDGALESGWVAEIEPRDDTEAPKINKRRIEVHEVYAQPKATQKLIDDSKVDIANWLMEKIADKFADVESEAFINGDGVGKPRGILSLPHGKDRNSIEQISLLGSELSADDIMNLYYSLPSKYAARASFLMHRNMLQKIRTLKCPNTGHYIWAPGLAVGQPDTLLGAPVYESPHMPIPASGALAIAFADFKQAYKIVDRTNINIIRDPFTEKPFVKFYATKRVGGSVINSSAMKLLKAA